MRHLPAAAGAALVLLLAATPAPAVILKLTPLKEVLDAEPLIFVASVDRVDPDRPAVVFKFEEKLKGDPVYDRLPVNLTGDAEAKKGEHAKVMLDRLAPGRRLVLFVTPGKKKHSAFGFLEGTWFQMQGTPDDDGKAVRWAFLHCEPYLRRTFKGTTAELRQVVADGLSGKAAPPGPNEKEPPGYGPVVEKRSEGPPRFGPGPGLAPWAIGCRPFGTPDLAPTGRQPLAQGVNPGHAEECSPLAPRAVRLPGSRAFASGYESHRSRSERTTFLHPAGVAQLCPGQRPGAESSRGAGGPAPSLDPPYKTRPALFAVIPSVVLVGPLAVIMALFPGVGARMAVQMTRWRAFLVIASLNSTLALVYYFVHTHLPNVWAAGETGFTVQLLGVTLVGLVWAGRRYRRAAAANPAVTAAPSRNELLSLVGMTAAVGLLVASVRLFGPWGTTVEIPMREFTFIGVGLLAATTYAVYRGLTRRDDTGAAAALGLSGESVGLGAMFACGVAAVVAANTGGKAVSVGAETADDVPPVGPVLADVRVFEFPDAHQVMSSVAVSGNRVYFGAAKQTGFKASGFVFAADADAGKPAWVFDADEELKPVFATPAVSGGTLFVGEGLHTDSGCRLYALDAATGKPAWAKPFDTASHTEGSPQVVSGKAYFSAGDDGLFCVDAKTGAEVWHAAGKDRGLHIDTPPAVANGKVFAGSGYYTNALLSFDATTGSEVWRVPTPLRSFGPPLVIGSRVVYGLGTGNLTLDTEGNETTPAGAVVCVDAHTGKEAWRLDLPKSVHTQLAADAFTVYATCRDGAVYALDRKTGRVRWKATIGGAVLGGPAVATAGGFPVAVYAASREGVVVCLNPHTGRAVWQRELPGFQWDGQEANGVFGTPAVIQAEGRRVVYVGAMLLAANTKKKTCAVFRFEDRDGE